MKKIKIKTIDIQAKEWFDRVNGNSYFAGTVTVNFGMPTEKTINMPFQYGYGSQYTHEAGSVLHSEGLIKLAQYSSGANESLWGYCEDNKIILRQSIQRNCLKRELMYY